MAEPASDGRSGGPCRDAVVDDDDVMAAHRIGVDDTREVSDTRSHLGAGARKRGLDPSLRRPEPSKERLVQDRDTIGSDRANRELLVSRSTDLASHDRPQRATEHPGNLRGHHDTPARDATHQRVVGWRATGHQLGTELATGVGPIGEDDTTVHRYAPKAHRTNGGNRMGISAYVLIQTEVGKAATVAQSVRKIGGVTAADDVTGPYDVIVRTEAESLDDLGKMVVSQIQAVEGITRTFTCPVVNL